MFEFKEELSKKMDEQKGKMLVLDLNHNQHRTLVEEAIIELKRMESIVKKDEMRIVDIEEAIHRLKRPLIKAETKSVLLQTEMNKKKD